MKKIPLMILLLTPLTAQAEIFTKGQICKAAIAVEMMRPAEGIVIVEEGTYPIVSYRRADDGKRFTYSCKISEQNNSVVWRGYLPDEKAWGRWRDGEYDSKIRFSVRGAELKVSSDPGSSKFFKHNQL